MEFIAHRDGVFLKELSVRDRAGNEDFVVYCGKRDISGNPAGAFRTEKMRYLEAVCYLGCFTKCRKLATAAGREH